MFRDGRERSPLPAWVGWDRSLCLLSAAGFGAMAIFGKLAYDAGVEVGELLLVRFALAAAPCSRVAGRARRAARAAAPGASLAALRDGRDRLRDAVRPVLLGARADGRLAARAAALHVPGARLRRRAIALGRERASARRIVRARASRRPGVALVLAGAATGSFDALGAAMGFGAALAYTAYILVGDRVVAGVPPLALAALVCTGRDGTFALAALVRGGPELASAPTGWGWLGAIALVSTVARDPRVLRRAGARRAVGGGDPLDVRAGRDGRAGRRGVRRVARAGAARSAARSCSRRSW